MPYPELKGLLTDIGTEELGHLEMIGTIVHQLTRNLNEDDIKTAGFDAYFVDHTASVYPTAASGFPWNAASMAVKGDLIADLTEDLAAEQKARVTYDNILRLSDDPDVNDVIKFLRAREVVHFQRLGEGLRLAKERAWIRRTFTISTPPLTSKWTNNGEGLPPPLFSESKNASSRYARAGVLSYQRKIGRKNKEIRAAPLPEGQFF